MSIQIPVFVYDMDIYKFDKAFIVNRV